jgi:uncharacterized membrane protein (DUF485 family)
LPRRNQLRRGLLFMADFDHYVRQSANSLWRGGWARQEGSERSFGQLSSRKSRESRAGEKNAEVSAYGNLGGAFMAATAIQIENNPKFKQLVAARKSLGWTLSAVMLLIYFGFILLVAFDKSFLGTPLGAGVTTIGIVIGLAVIISAFVLTGIYVSKANATYDALTKQIVEESK